MKTIELLMQAQFHGARRIAMSKHKSVWAAIFVLLLCCAVVVQVSTINRFFSNPTYLIKQESIGSLKRFPNVLIYPQTNLVEEKMDVFVNEVQYPVSLNSSYMRRVLRQLAAFISPDVEYDAADLQNIQRLLDHNRLDVDAVGRRLTASCEEILLRCRWRGLIVNCSNLFVMEITHTGYACVFNGRSLKREIQLFGVKRVGPARDVNVSSTGFADALMVVVDQTLGELKNIDTDYKWVALQAGQHYVDIGVNGTPISPGAELWVEYETRSVRSDVAARNLHSSVRKCHLEEHPMDYFPLYHESYCLLECEIRRTITRCHCSKLSYPPVRGVPLCRAEQLRCAREIAVSYQKGECDCTPTCDVDIDALVPEISSYSLHSSANTLDDLYEGFDFERVSVIRVYISPNKKRISQMKSYFTSYDLFSQMAGTVTLFFGCSILTLLELLMLLYRLWLEKRKSSRKRQKKKITIVKFKKNIVDVKKNKTK